MPRHEDQVCPRCGVTFECKVGSVFICGCTSIELTDDQLSRIRSLYYGCLCLSCLRALKVMASHGRPGDTSETSIPITPRPRRKRQAGYLSGGCAGETIDHGVTVGPVRSKAGNKRVLRSSLRTCGIPDADSMKARTKSPQTGRIYDCNRTLTPSNVSSRCWRYV